MRALHLVTMAAFCIALPVATQAQSTTTQQSTTTVSTTSYGQGTGNQWFASGFAGGNFANNADPASPAFGGSIGYLWKSRVGGAFDAGFTPDFQLQSNFFGLGIKPIVNTYMANAVAAMPFGPDNKWQPFIAGGVGAVSLRSGLSSSDFAGAINSTFNPDATRVGGDIGGGIMGFMGNWGFKADLQYFRTSGSYQTSAGSAASGYTGTTSSGAGTTSPGTGTTPAPPGGYSIAGASSQEAGVDGSTADSSTLADTVLSGLHFWRANIGLALRW